MRRLILPVVISLTILLMLAGCSTSDVNKKNSGRAIVFGPEDAMLSDSYDTYQFKFLDKYRITHDWPTSSKCNYRSWPTIAGGGNLLNQKTERNIGVVAIGSDIIEAHGRTWQITLIDGGTVSFDRYVRSVKYMSPIYLPISQEELESSRKILWERIERQRRTGVLEKIPTHRQPVRHEEVETGWNPVCYETWWNSSTYLLTKLYRRDITSWRELQTERYPEGRWVERRIRDNTWFVQEVAPDQFYPRPLNGLGGPFQTWLMPIGDTGYTIAFELGASKESLQYPETLERLKNALSDLIKSVRIDPLTPEIEAEIAELKERSLDLERKKCKSMRKPFVWCEALLEKGPSS